MPPRTQPGTVLRLVGRGLPVFGEKRRGNLLIRVRVHVPEELCAEERELYERVQKLEATATSS